jgi:Ca2+-binding RTX toxin-like protein
MNSTATYLEQAELALAAYSNLTPGMTDAAYKLALIDDGKGMSTIQAAAFASKWTVLDQYTPTEQVPVYDNFGVIVDYVEQYSGLSATVFKEVATGKRHLAIRGTEITDLGDLTADGGVLLHGIPDLSDQYQSLHAKVAEWQTNGVLFGTFTVAGHSLGGWLAEGLAVDFAASIEHTYVYNSPGLFGAGFGDLLQQINDALGTSFLSVPNLANLTNIRASAGLSFIAGLGQPLSPPIGIVTEDQTQSDVPNPAGSRNHSQRVLTDSLAVYTLFAELSSSLTVENIGAILNASGNRNAMTLEDAVNALGDLFQAGSAIEVADDRDALYTRIQAIRDSAGYQLAVQVRDFITVQPLTEFDAATIAAQSRADTPDGLAYRYALVNLLPFALTGDASLYAGHNAAGQLDLHDPATGQGTLTDQYIKDRARMLSWKMQYDTGAEDADDDPLGILSRTDKPYTEEWDGWTVTGDWDFIDHTTVVGGSPLKLTIDGVDLSTTANHRIVFGSNGADSLVGDVLNDNLYGGGGNDTLTGGGGNDWLEGGQGYDTYLLNPGDGTDTLLDVDGLGVIKFGDVKAQGSAGIAPAKWLHVADSDIWIDTHNGISYTKSIVDGEPRLLVRKGDSNVLVKGWSDGELGIVLGTAAPAVPPDPPTVLTGTATPNHLQAAPGGQRVEGLAGADMILGSGASGADHLLGGDGADWIVGNGGADHIEGGSGDDYITGLGANGIVQGGDGNDLITAALAEGIQLTGIGNVPGLTADILWADAQSGFGRSTGLIYDASGNLDLAHGSVPLAPYGGASALGGGWSFSMAFGGSTWNITYSHPTLAPGGKTPTGYWEHFITPVSLSEGVFLFGDAGDDLIVGNNGADYLDGGSGADQLFGHAGDDVLDGATENDLLAGGDGRDILLGGKGDDQLYGEQQDDVLIGGSGNDVLWGDSPNALLAAWDGDDYLDGADGDDQLGGGPNGRNSVSGLPIVLFLKTNQSNNQGIARAYN